MSEEIKQNNNLEEEKISSAGRLERYLRLILIFAAIILVGAAISFAAPYFFSQNQSARVNSPKPDEIVVTKLPDGSQLVENKTAGYEFEAPSGWSISPINNIGNGSVQLLASQNSTDSNCNYGVSKIPKENNNINLADWYKQNYSDGVESISSQSIKNIEVANLPAIEVITFVAGKTNAGVKNIYVDYNNSYIYGFGYNFYSQIDEDKCNLGLEKIIQSFNFLNK